jgi:hypothetical protein
MPSKQPPGRDRDNAAGDPEFSELSDGDESDDVPQNPEDPETPETPAPFAHPSEADFALDRLIDQIKVGAGRHHFGHEAGHQALYSLKTPDRTFWYEDD